MLDFQGSNLPARSHMATDAKSSSSSHCFYDGTSLTGLPDGLSNGHWGLLGPAARVLKGGANALHGVLRGRSSGTTAERTAARRDGETRQILQLRLKNAVTMEAWRSAAMDLDVFEGNEAWKHDPESPFCDVALIEARTKALDDARIGCDVKAMLNLVRTALSRDLGGMGNIKLYGRCYIGTKDLIERYIDSTLDTIRALVEMSKYSLPEGLQARDILDASILARQAFGRSALLLSGGATFGMNHVGVLKALFEAHLLPRIISGASAGSIVCAVLCTRTDEEIPEVLKAFPFGDLAVFEDAEREDGILERVRRLLTEGCWIDIRHLSRVMRELLGDMTFQEAYNRSRRILNITVSSASVYELPRLLNYVTSPNVMIWSAVAASCSVPILFSNAELLVKNPITGQNAPWDPTPQRWIDGSVDNDLPMTRLAEMFNVNHFIVSQVNPHVIPFLAKEDEAATRQAHDEVTGPGWVYTLTNLAKDETLHRMHVLAELGIFPNLVTKCRSILSQKYSGDITILPAIEFKDFPRMLKNPTSDFMVQACLAGERATWPKLSRIRNHCAVELELDAAVQALRARVVFSPSQVDLRRLTTGTVRRQRTNSGNHISKLTNDTAVKEVRGDEAIGPSKKAATRPPIRTTQSHIFQPQRYNQPSFLQPTALQLSALRLEGSMSQVSPGLGLNIDMPDFSSAGETARSTPSSDADIDSYTDDSSPETNDADLTMRAHTSAREVDFFSINQPVTPRGDRMLATTPASKSNAGQSHSPSLLSLPVRRKGDEYMSVTAPCSPERRYKRMFHHWEGDAVTK